MAERPNYTGSGRTVMTAPIRAAAPNPERDADRGTGQGLEAFGRGLASLGQSVYQVGQFREQEKRRAEAVQEENKRISSQDLMDHATAEARRIAADLEVKHKNFAGMGAEQMRAVGDEFETLWQESLNEYRKTNPLGQVSPEKLSTVSSQYRANFLGRGAENDDRLRIADRLADLETNLDADLAAIDIPVDAASAEDAVAKINSVRDARYRKAPDHELSKTHKAAADAKVQKYAFDMLRSLTDTATPQNQAALLAVGDMYLEAGLISKVDRKFYGNAIESKSRSFDAFNRKGAEQEIVSINEDIRAGAGNQQTVQYGIEEAARLQRAVYSDGGKNTINETQFLTSYVKPVINRVLGISAQSIALSPSPVPLGSVSMFSEGDLHSSVTAYQAFANMFVKAPEADRRANFIKYAESIGISAMSENYIAALGVAPMAEIDAAIGSLNTTWQQRLEMDVLGQGNLMVEQTSEHRQGMVEAGGDPAKIKALYAGISARLGLQNPINIPSAEVNELASALGTALSGGDTSAVQVKAAQLARDYGMDAVKLFDSVRNQRKVGPNGELTKEPLVSAEAGTVMIMGMFPQTNRDASPENKHAAISLMHGNLAMLSRRPAVEKALATEAGRRQEFDQFWGEPQVAQMLRPFGFAARADTNAPETLGEGIPSFIKMYAEDLYVNKGLHPLAAIREAAQVVNNSITPTRLGRRYGFVNMSHRKGDENILSFAKWGMGSGTSETARLTSAMLDLVGHGNLPAASENFSAAGMFWRAKQALPYSFPFNMLGMRPGNGRDLADPMLSEQILMTNYHPGQAVGILPVLSFEKRFQPFGSMAVKWDEVYVEQGPGREPVQLGNIGSPEHRDFPPEEKWIRLREKIKGIESVSLEERAATIFKQNIVWVENAEEGRFYAYVEAKPTGIDSKSRVEQRDSWIPLSRKNSVGKLEPFYVSKTDLGLAADVGRSKAPGWLDTQPFQVRYD